MNPSQPSQAAKAGTWFQLSPFGSFRGANSVHVFDQGAAAAMVRAFDQAKAGNLIPRGLPVFIGDPEADPKANPDQRKYGSILALEVRADGLWAQARWNKAGKDLLANDHFAYVAPHWQTEPLPGQPGSVRPVELVSAGLTNWPPAGDAKPVAANAADPAVPSPSSVHTTAENTLPTMKNEPAADRYWMLVYSRITATGEPQAKAAENVQMMHKSTYAEYLAEQEAAQAETVAADKAAIAAIEKKNQAANDRAVRQTNIQAAVDAVLKRAPGLDYGAAYRLIEYERPELFI